MSSDLWPGSEESLPYVVGGVALLIAITGIVLLLSRAGSSGGTAGIAGGGEEPFKEKPFNPPTRSEGAASVMPLTLVDGTTVELVYRSSANLAALGVRLYGSARLEGCCHRELLIDYGPRGSFTGGSTPETQIPGADGKPVEVWPGRNEDPRKYLTFHFGSWTVGISDGADKTRLNPTQRAQFASALLGQETADGFLVLDARAPVSLEKVGGVAGPTVEVGNIRGHGLLLVPGSCQPPEGPGVETKDGVAVRRQKLVGKKETVFLCFPDLPMAIQVYGDAKFVGTVTDGLKLRNLRPAAAPAG